LYPLFLAFIPEYFGKNFDKASSIIVSLGTVGGLILPWLAGLILNKIGAKPYALLILLSMGLILVMAIPLSKKLRDRQEQS
jgi:fucose permease